MEGGDVSDLLVAFGPFLVGVAVGLFVLVYLPRRNDKTAPTPKG
jgi:hypothetical protein